MVQPERPTWWFTPPLSRQRSALRPKLHREMLVQRVYMQKGIGGVPIKTWNPAGKAWSDVPASSIHEDKVTGRYGGPWGNTIHTGFSSLSLSLARSLSLIHTASTRVNRFQKRSLKSCRKQTERKQTPLPPTPRPEYSREEKHQFIQKRNKKEIFTNERNAFLVAAVRGVWQAAMCSGLQIALVICLVSFFFSFFFVFF